MGVDLLAEHVRLFWELIIYVDISVDICPNTNDKFGKVSTMYRIEINISKMLLIFFGVNKMTIIQWKQTIARSYKPDKLVTSKLCLVARNDDTTCKGNIFYDDMILWEKKAN